MGRSMIELKNGCLMNTKEGTLIDITNTSLKEHKANLAKAFQFKVEEAREELRVKVEQAKNDYSHQKMVLENHFGKRAKL